MAQQSWPSLHGSPCCEHAPPVVPLLEPVVVGSAVVAVAVAVEVVASVLVEASVPLPVASVVALVVAAVEPVAVELVELVVVFDSVVFLSPGSPQQAMVAASTRGIMRVGECIPRG